MKATRPYLCGSAARTTRLDFVVVMHIATGMYGPFDVTTIEEIVIHLDQYDGGEAIYVKDGEPLGPTTPAVVLGPRLTDEELRSELRFRYLADVDMAREAAYELGNSENGGRLQELLELIDEYGH